MTTQVNKDDLICGDKFVDISRYILDDDGFRQNINSNLKNVYFVNSENIDNFFKNYLPSSKFILITHNSDINIDEKYLQYLKCSHLHHWFAQNLLIKHPKISPIPIGIANEKWKHGNKMLFEKVINQSLTKDNLLYANFNFRTNKFERISCMIFLLFRGVFKKRNIFNFEIYLQQLSRSFFCISPIGNGIDCHRFWEALYFGTIPVVKENVFYNNFKELPKIVIKKWFYLPFLILNKKRYYKLQNKLNINQLKFNFYYNLIKNKSIEIE